MATKKTTRKSHSTKKQPMRSFKVAREEMPFNTFKFTRQTFYWILLLAFIAFTQLWIIKLQLQISDLTDTLLQFQQQL